MSNILNKIFNLSILCVSAFTRCVTLGKFLPLQNLISSYAKELKICPTYSFPSPLEHYGEDQMKS